MTISDIPTDSSDYDPNAQYWSKRPGKDRVFQTPADLMDAAIEAFTWLHTHPKRKQVIFHNKGAITKTYETLERPFSIHAVAMCMGISLQCLNGYRERPEFAEALAWIDGVIYTQKFEGAAVGTLNANFIARDLGMADRSEVTGKDGGPLKTQDASADVEALLNEARRLGIDVAALGFGGSA